jgi:hypothetical protein
VVPCPGSSRCRRDVPRPSGLGFLISTGNETFGVAQIFTAVMLCVTMAFLGDNVLRFAERRLLRWRNSRSDVRPEGESNGGPLCTPDRHLSSRAASLRPASPARSRHRRRADSAHPYPLKLASSREHECPPGHPPDRAGIFLKHGIQLQPIPVNNVVTSVQALAAGNTDVAFIDVPNSISAARRVSTSGS